MPPKENDFYSMLAEINERTIRTEEQTNSIKEMQVARASHVDTQFFTINQKLDGQHERLNQHSSRLGKLENWRSGVVAGMALIGFYISNIWKKP